jgi:hypothetical protein
LIRCKANDPKAIGGGAYIDELNRYWERPGGKTWRVLRNAGTKRDAIKIASSRDPKTIGRDFESLATAYTEAGCPDARLQPRGFAIHDGPATFENSGIPRFDTRKVLSPDKPSPKRNKEAQEPKNCKGPLVTRVIYLSS